MSYNKFSFQNGYFLTKLCKRSSIIIILLVVSLFIQITYIQISDVTTVSSAGRIFAVKRWLASCSFPIFVHRPPLYLYTMAGVISLVRHVFQGYLQFNLTSIEILNLRLFSLFFSLLSIVVYFYLINETFNKKIAVFSTFLLTIYPTYIKWSTIPVEVTMFLFFLLSSLFFIIRFKKTKKLKAIFFASISLSIICMLRLEGWILIPVLGIFLIKWRYYKPFLIFISISLIFPTVWMLIDYYFTGDAFYYLTDNNLLVREILPLEHSSIVERILYWPKLLNGELPYLVSPLIVLGLVHSIIKKRNFYLATISFIFLVIFIYKTVNHTLNTIDRYILPCGILFIPYAGIILEKLWGLRSKIFSIGIIIFLFFSGAKSIEKSINDRWRISGSERKINNWIIRNVRKEDFVLVGNVDCNFYGVLINSGLDPCRSYVFDLKPDTEIELKDFFVLIENKKPKYLILPKKRSELYSFINSPWSTKAKTFLNYEFVPRFLTNRYAVYEIS